MTEKFDTHDWVIAGILLLIVILGVWFIARHSRDVANEQRIKDLQVQVAQDSLARERLVAKTDSLVSWQDSLARRALHGDTVFRTTSRIVRDTLTRLLRQTDTVIAHEVLRQVDTIRVQGERALQACTDALSACELVKAQFQTERQAWATERADLQQVVKTQAKLSRHWGLGVTCGGAATYASGLVHAGPGCALGFTWRW